MEDKLFLNETVTMCSGVGCGMKNKCYRYRLNKFFDYPKLKRKHKDPQFLEPAFKDGGCRNFAEIRYQEE